MPTDLKIFKSQTAVFDLSIYVNLRLVNYNFIQKKQMVHVGGNFIVEYQ